MEVTKPNDPQCSNHFHMLGEKERGSFNTLKQLLIFQKQPH